MVYLQLKYSISLINSYKGKQYDFEKYPQPWNAT